jgi:signal transduction histidine kinase
VLAVTESTACVSVTDHGPGLSTGDLSRVFDKFVRGRSTTTSGTGLGLYICRQIIEAHGGTIRAESTPGGGATLVFELALVSSQSEEPVDA